MRAARQGIAITAPRKTCGKYAVASPASEQGRPAAANPQRLSTTAPQRVGSQTYPPEGQRARKGVFITISTFSADARQCAERIDTRIILIDGTELARLMIAHGVGVTAVAVYELKRVDSDFFAED